MSNQRDRRELLHLNQRLLPWSPGRSVTTAKAAELLGVCQTTIRNMLECKELDGYKLRPLRKNSPYRVFRDSIERHMNGVREEYELDGAK